MNSTRPDQQRNSGFAVVEALIILVVVIALAFAGWFVWQKNKDDKPTDGANNTSQASNNETGKEQAASEGNYLVIKEWGLRIPLSEEIKRAYYTFAANDLAESVSLFDAAFDDMQNANGISCGGSNKYKFYAISRAKPENAASLSEPIGREYRSFPFTSGFVFSGLGAHQAPPYCANLNADPYGPYQEDMNILETANDKERAFDEAFGRLELSR